MSRPGMLVAAGAVGGAAAMAIGAGALPGEMRDFEVYWTAAARALSSEPLYRATDGHYQFKYLPAFAVLASPVALVPLQAAKAAWFVGSVALLTALLASSLALLPAQRRTTSFLVAVMILTMGKFYGHELVLGQVNLLFAVVVALAILMLDRRRDTAAAALFVAALVVKPYALLMLPWLAFRRGRHVIPATAMALAAVLLLPAVLYGLGGTVDLHRAWWTTVTESTAPNLTNADNVSLAGFFAKWLGSGTAAAVATSAASAVLIGSIAVVVLRGSSVAAGEPLEGALLLTAIPLLSPQGWDYVFLVATPAVALIANYERELPKAVRVLSWAALLTIGLSLFDLMGREHYAVFMNWSVITACFIVIVGVLTTLRVRRIA